MSETDRQDSEGIDPSDPETLKRLRNREMVKRDKGKRAVGPDHDSPPSDSGTVPRVDRETSKRIVYANRQRRHKGGQ